MEGEWEWEKGDRLISDFRRESFLLYATEGWSDGLAGLEEGAGGELELYSADRSW